jgi:hypothetical protein
MARGKSTTTDTQNTVAKTTGSETTRRVTTLEPKAGKALSSLEEAVVRMHHGVSVKSDAVLATNGASEELMAKLLEMEVAAFTKSGRIDELEDVPAQAARRAANPRTSRIVAELKKRS